MIGVAAVLLLVLGGAGFAYASFSKKQAKTATNGGVSDMSGVETAAVSANSCGVKLSEVKPSGKRLIEEADEPVGAELRNTGDSDSATEYCEVVSLRKAAESFLTSIGSHDWNKAYSLLSSSAKSVPLATKIDNWSQEYGKYPVFNLASLPLSSAGSTPRYAVETCLADASSGWATKIASGYYTTPDFKLTAEANGTTTTISVAMVKEKDAWLVNGDANDLHNTSGIVGGDAYSQGQNKRTFNPYTCE